MQHCWCTISCQLYNSPLFLLLLGKILQNYSWNNHHHENASHLPLFHSWGCSRPELWWAGLVTWIIHPCATVFCSVLFSSVLLCSVLWCYCGFWSKKQKLLVLHRLLAQNCSSLTVLQTSYRGHYQSSKIEKSVTIFQGWVLDMAFPCYSKKSSWGWDQATTVLRSIISPGLD